MSEKRPDRRAQARRILVIANETVAATALHHAIRFRAHNVAGEVLVVVPVAAPPGRGDARQAARAAAEERLARSLERLRAAGVAARGQVGDRDPLQAIGDALAGFAADEILIATHPAAHSGWLERDLVERARAMFGRPVLHVVADQGEHSMRVRGVGRFVPRVTDPTPSAS
jgi:hypothetical protein